MQEGKNLLILFSDQHNKHMVGSYGNKVIKTPYLDRLAEEGVTFTDAYTPCPLCAPARAAMAIGDYASKHHYYDNVLAYNGGCQSWAGRLEEQGVHTTTVGKLHFKSATPDTGFLDQRIPLHIKDGIGDVYGEIRDREITRPQFRNALYEAKEGETDYIKFDREVARRAASFLREEAPKREKPFVLMADFVSPHFPLAAPEEFSSLYRIEDIPDPVQFDAKDWPHHPVIDDYRRYCCQEHVPAKVRKEAIRIYYGMCSFVDAQIGIVLDALKESGLEKDTYVLYISDHGDTMGEHGVFFKSTLYEGSVGIPMILKGPGIDKGKKESSPVSLVDIYPTALGCTGVVPNDYDRTLPGVSLLATLRKPDPAREIYSEYQSFGFYTSAFMLRKGKWKFIFYVGERPQLFNLEEDPDECKDLAEDPAYQGICKALEKDLRDIVDIEKTDAQARAAQKEVMEEMGGKEEFLKSFKPSLFSPIPDLTK
ncbi:MAG: sulfatase-like hydrolase/transferase [Spirochaetaceae bacterium]|nr:sulfatase-like hydrolase/transferase [Spirochaetaceae bacterium]